MIPGRLVVTAVVVVLGIGGSACSKGSSPKATTTVTTRVTVAPSGATSPSASVTTSVSPSPKPTPKPTSSQTLGGDCSSILPVTAVDKAVGAAVPGKTAFIVNQPDPTIDQVERVNCRYGLVDPPKGKKAGPAPVEVSVSLYASSASAAKRIDATEEEWRQNSAHPHTVQVAGHNGTVLLGYGDPLLVLAVGPRTVAASIAPTVTKPANVDAVLAGLAAAALRGAGG